MGKKKKKKKSFYYRGYAIVLNIGSQEIKIQQNTRNVQSWALSVSATDLDKRESFQSVLINVETINNHF